MSSDISPTVNDPSKMTAVLSPTTLQRRTLGRREIHTVSVATITGVPARPLPPPKHQKRSDDEDLDTDTPSSTNEFEDPEDSIDNDGSSDTQKRQVTPTNDRD